ncbi:MAG: hypothetical protein U0271_29200 [Polyangiaceae bacterium]
MKRSIPLVFAAALTTLAGCMPPNSPTDKLTETAYDVVMAARFGRMDIVLDSVHPVEREGYSESHVDWGGQVRILDIEYGGARMTGPDTAVVFMTVAWQRLDESFLRSSSIKQTWKRVDRWLITKEEIAAGDHGLLKKFDKGKEGDPQDAMAADHPDEHLIGPEPSAAFTR